MTLEQLRDFAAVAEAGSMSRAAMQLCMTQPALSRQVRRLETELCVDLFYRHGRGVVLTDAGARLREVLAPIFEELENVRRELREYGKRETGQVTLAVPPSIGASMCASLSRRFARAFPEARLRVREGFSSTLSEWIEAGQVDLAILYDARRRRDLLVTPLIREQLYFVQRGADPAAAGPVDWNVIRRAPLILPGLENGMRRVVEKAARKSGVELTIVAEIDSVSAIRQLVAAGDGATILPFGAVHADVSSGLLTALPIAEAGLSALLVVATPRSRPVSRVTRALAKLIEAEVMACVEAGVLRGDRASTIDVEDDRAPA